MIRSISTARISDAIWPSELAWPPPMSGTAQRRDLLTDEAMAVHIERLETYYSEGEPKVAGFTYEGVARPA